MNISLFSFLVVAVGFVAVFVWLILVVVAPYRCPHCRRRVNKRATACPHCTRKLTGARR